LIDLSIAALSVASLEKGILRKLSNQLHRMTVGQLTKKRGKPCPPEIGFRKG
jgi:hypothetical protein